MITIYYDKQSRCIARIELNHNGVNHLSSIVYPCQHDECSVDVYLSDATRVDVLQANAISVMKKWKEFYSVYNISDSSIVSFANQGPVSIITLHNQIFKLFKNEKSC